MNTKDDPEKPEDEFDLVGPTGELAKRDDDAERPDKKIVAPRRAKPRSDESLRQMSWKGFEEDKEEVVEDPPMSFYNKMDNSDDGMDMTPMVDVTFLLLIFFMVTASFSIQRSIQQPPSQINEPSLVTVEEPENEDDYVEVIIDQNDNFFVTTRGDEEVETPSETQMRAKVRNAAIDYGATRLMITAHVDSTHEKVIKVWDAGYAAGMQKIQMRTTELEY